MATHWLVEKHDLFVLLQGAALSMRSDTFGEACVAFRRSARGMAGEERAVLARLVRREVTRWQVENGDGGIPLPMPLPLSLWMEAATELEGT
jgi:hypothetical protein